MSSFSYSDTRPEDDADRSDVETTRRKHALREVARAALLESVAGFHFGHCEEPLQTLRRLHDRVQVLKGQSPPHDDTLSRARNERAHQASYVGQLLVGLQGRMPLPARVENAIGEFLALDRLDGAQAGPSTAMRESPPDVERLLDTDYEEEDTEEPEEPEILAEEEEAGLLHIHGLEAIPPCGTPLQVFNVPEPPVTLASRLRILYDNTDYWYQQHRTPVLWGLYIVSALLCILNVFAMLYTATHEETYIAASPMPFLDQAQLKEPGILDGSGPLTSSYSSSLNPNSASNRRFLLYVSVFGILAGGAAYLIYRSRIKSIELARRYSLRMVKAAMIPVDVAVQYRTARFFDGYYVDTPEPAKPAKKKSPATILERRVRTAQITALALLVAALVFPPFVYAAKQYTASADPAGVMEGEGLSPQSADSPSGAQGEALRAQLRKHYVWFTALIVLILLSLLLTAFLRKVHNIASQRAHQCHPGADKVTAEPKPWLQGDGNSIGEGREPEIDHEDPYGAMARSVAGESVIRTLRARFKIEAMIVRYRMFNKWRIIHFFATLADSTFRLLGVLVFGVLLLVSVVMPLIVLSIFQENNAGQIEAFRATMQELFPELVKESPTAESDSATAADGLSPDDDLSRGRLSLARPEVAPSPPAEGWALPYVFTLAGIVGLNLLLLGARLLTRRRSRHQHAGSNRRLTVEVAVSSLAVVACLWLWDLNFTSASAIDTGSANGAGLQYRPPMDETQVQILTEEKFFSQYFLPESTFRDVWYVDVKSQATIRDGQSWHTAFHTLYGGLRAARAAGGGEVWVGSGWYRFNPDVKRDNAAYAVAFTIPDDVHVYGGFAGATPGGYEQSRLERNWRTHLTVLDIRSRSAGLTESQCVYGTGTWTLDGFILLGGHILGGPPRSKPPSAVQVDGVVGNMLLVFPGEPEAYALGPAAGKLLFHHDVIWNRSEPRVLGFQAYVNAAGPCDL